ncbi:peptide-methionine (R)-S-oxide reductase MsrB [Cellulophaga baltica]|uniref:peptide-methionine (R)-S-oxide reductase MsrB n=1 Tax=Cellulophaga TaxID=104264 RepID=UPI001C064EC7|nr:MULTISPECIES: peptide-methionine (R)-S-oxide reductase MsrB [Cellulophaga]MBU2996702.1 peptide-methionine (R)-S-oxide reductase MsrB [Cellulophaga baltica]MDO6768096.1 peptide-methionine (R)-S-oxide reductase MsrB [Cellulophaga sp. 1_MG-2023]
MLTWKSIISFTAKGNSTPDKRVEKSEQEWRTLLTEEQYKITRKKGTEPAHSGALCSTHKVGKYNCICCNAPLFDSTIKFESQSGWPSFTQPIKENAIKYIKDVSFGMIRVEVLCNICDAHLGHVFPDGPEPTGLRYCVNSEAITLENL